MSAALGFLGRLRRDARGNVLAMMAAMLIPLAAFSGAAIDMGRLYAVKSRLQQACDAGVLAGAKFMNGNTIDTSDSGPAKTFFKSNFTTGWFSTAAVAAGQAVFTPSVTTDNHVAGTASVNVPMTIMKMFGQSTKTLRVTCEAQFDGDIDIMFVLDTTGSMACLPSDDDGTCGNWDVSHTTSDSNGYYVSENTQGSRIDAVRTAVAGPLVNGQPVSFFDVLMSKADPATAFRFGFVPFSSMVNVGKLLPNNYLASSWNYQSRQLAQGSSSNYVYKQYNGVNTSQYILGGAVDNPAQPGSTTSTWNGCLEERIDPNSTPGTTSFDPGSPPLDLDVDKAPGAGDPKWGPAWPDIIFWRQTTPESSTNSRVNAYRPITGYSSYDNVGALLLEELACPAASVQRLTSYKLAPNSSNSDRTTLKTSMQNFMKSGNGFRPFGVTYLDEGMTWGTRMFSPQGMFASDTAPWPGHRGVNRYLIFLTDGTMETDCFAYSAHGIEAYDKRVLSSSCTNGNNTANIGPSADPTTALNAAHKARFQTACTIAKNHNITVFVILFGQSVASAKASNTPPAEYIACASPGGAYYASDSTGLTAAFNAIAGQVALLRLAK